VVRQGFDGELSRTAHHPEPFESLTAPRRIEGEDRGAEFANLPCSKGPDRVQRARWHK